jgi:hypothetical protein
LENGEFRKKAAGNNPHGKVEINFIDKNALSEVSHEA